RSVVTKSIPDNALAVGSPAKVIRDKVCRDVPDDEAMALVAKYIKGFSQKKGWQLSEAGSGNLLSFVDNENRPRFHIHHELREDVAPVDVLSIILSGNQEKAKTLPHPLYFLNSEISSAASSLGTDALDFFEYCRQFGLRFYPWDELERSN